MFDNVINVSDLGPLENSSFLNLGDELSSVREKASDSLQKQRPGVHNSNAVHGAGLPREHGEQSVNKSGWTNMEEIEEDTDTFIATRGGEKKREVKGNQ